MSTYSISPFRSEEEQYNINSLLVKSTDYRLVRSLAETPEHNFGNMYEAHLFNQKCICRSISFQRPTRYMIEEFCNDVRNIALVYPQEEPFVRPIGVHIEKGNFLIFYPKHISLFDILHN